MSFPVDKSKWILSVFDCMFAFSDQVKEECFDEVCKANGIDPNSQNAKSEFEKIIDKIKGIDQLIENVGPLANSLSATSLEEIVEPVQKVVEVACALLKKDPIPESDSTSIAIRNAQIEELKATLISFEDPVFDD
jgi:hypothetical protein